MITRLFVFCVHSYLGYLKRFANQMSSPEANIQVHLQLALFSLVVKARYPTLCPDDDSNDDDEVDLANREFVGDERSRPLLPPVTERQRFGVGGDDILVRYPRGVQATAHVNCRGIRLDLRSRDMRAIQKLCGWEPKPKSRRCKRVIVNGCRRSQTATMDNHRRRSNNRTPNTAGVMIAPALGSEDPVRYGIISDIVYAEPRYVGEWTPKLVARLEVFRNRPPTDGIPTVNPKRMKKAIWVLAKDLGRPVGFYPQWRRGDGNSEGVEVDLWLRDQYVVFCDHESEHERE
jgi:hypothetical protein